VQHDAAVEALADRVGEILESLEVTTRECGGCLDLNAHDAAAPILQHDVHLAAGGGTIEEHSGASGT
jgi:hypothetical protein